jgi:hypothetical protein
VWDRDVGDGVVNRKILQHFADVFCQMFLNSGCYGDSNILANLGSGTVRMDLLTQQCWHNDMAMPTLRTCSRHKAWLRDQLLKHRIPESRIEEANLEIDYSVELWDKGDWHHLKRCATFHFDCRGIIRTDEKEYVSIASDTQDTCLESLIKGVRM